VTFSGNFFPLKVPEFLHVLFNLVEKHSTVSFFFLAEMLLFGFVVFIVHASIFCFRFSQKKCKPAKKITGEWLPT